jgi:hypothetical protein
VPHIWRAFAPDVETADLSMGMKLGLRKAWLAITPSFVISTEAKRSGEMTKWVELRMKLLQLGPPIL